MTDNNTYLLTPWNRVFPEKLTRPQLVKKFPAFYGTLKIITAFTRARHLCLSWKKSSPCPLSISLKIYLIISHLCLGLPSYLFPSGSPTNTLYTHVLVSPSRSSRLDHPKNNWYRSWRSSLCSLLHSPVTLFFVCPNILLSTLFSNTLILRFPSNMRDPVSHPYKTTGKIIFLYIITFI